LPPGKAAVSAEKNLGGVALSKPVSVIGIEPDELRWVKILVSLLRHPNPGMPELARQALQYLVQAANQRTPPPEPMGKKEYGHL
jgi:hypothetical protein